MAIKSDGSCRLFISVETIKRDRPFQSLEDIDMAEKAILNSFGLPYSIRLEDGSVLTLNSDIYVNICPNLE